MNACAQVLCLDWFGAIRDRSLFEQSSFNLGIWIGRDEDRRHRIASRNEPVKKFDPAHSRHLYVDDQTAGFIYRS
jgi:hypothetical protein